jgi:hypothetical protein
MPFTDPEKRKEYIKEYNLKNKEKLKDKNKMYRQENKEKLIERSKEYYLNNKESICEKVKQYTANNKELVLERKKQWRLENKCEHNKRKENCKVCCMYLYMVKLQRTRLQRILNDTTLTKTKSTIEYLDCSPEYFKEYLQKKMTEEMTFDNIHIDHIKPVSKFNFEDPEELLKCCHYTNMQPLLASVNISKNNKWSDEDDVFWNENIIHKEYLPLYLPK